MTMPPMRKCPLCGLHMQDGDGPNGLVWHECRSETHTTARDLIQSAANDPDLNIDGATIACFRVALSVYLEDNEADVRGMGDMLKAMGPLKEAGGGAKDGLAEFLKGFSDV